MEINLKNLIKDNTVQFNSYRQGFFYYNITYLVKGVNTNIKDNIEYGTVFQFPIPIEDIGGAFLLKEDKAITFMRWIRKAIEDNTFIKV